MFNIFILTVSEQMKKKGQVSELGKHFISFREIIYKVSENNLRSIKSPLQLQNVDVLSPK